MRDKVVLRFKTAAGFPVGARVLVDGKVQAIVKQYFPEGSSSFMFPHYKLDFVGGDRNVAVNVSRVGVGKKPSKLTFKEAREVVLGFLKKRGWKVAENLSVPHATSPDGKVRLWFKSQAVYAVHQDSVKEEGADPLQFKDSHSMTSDVRDDTDETKFMKMVEHWTGYKD